MPDRLKVGFIAGPTGSGKSALAVALAIKLGAEIVNADSRQFYRGMDIGSAKPSAQERGAVRHHLVDVRDPREPLDAAEFAAMARAAIEDIARRGRRPLVVGGSGLYLRALRGGIFAGAPASPEIRRELNDLAGARGVPFLHDELARVDPEAAARIQRNDLYRIVRALEVYRITGIPISRHQRAHRFAATVFDSLTIAIEIPRQRLYEKINERFDAMVAAGLVAEVKGLLEAGCDPGRPPLSTIGYKEIAAYLRGELALEAAVELAKRRTRQLAKRQLTWFRHEANLIWVDADSAGEQALRLLEDFFATASGAQPF